MSFRESKEQFQRGELVRASTYAPVLCGLIVLYLSYLAIYRLYLSPVAKFPGPKLAALTFWYEAWYDVAKGGQYTFKLAELHKKYGPIIRINPYELHIDDPEYYDQLYVSAMERRTDKWAWSLSMFNIPTSVFTTISHDLHRRRRAAMSPYLSRASILRLEPLVRSKVDRLCARIEQASGTGGIVKMWHAYTALSADIVSAVAFPKGLNLLEEADFASQLAHVFERVSRGGHFVNHFPWILSIVQYLPHGLVKRVLPDISFLLTMRVFFFEQVQALKSTGASTDPKSNGRPTVFGGMANADVPESEKSDERLTDEAETLIAAGVLTTSTILQTITFHVLWDPKVLSCLISELHEAVPDANSLPSLNALERLPYLTAVIWEGLRMAYGVSHRLQRVSPDVALRYADWSIPPGVPVSMTSVLVHDNPALYPEPKSFRPERWLPLESEGRRLQKYLVSYGRGTRSCVGMNLANAELYLALTAVFRKFGNRMTVVDTSWEKDIAMAIDAFSPFPMEGSNGLQVCVHE